MTSKAQPGDHVRWFARSRGWHLAKKNIMVEGQSDHDYFQLASDLYFREHGRKLICNELCIFPCGLADEGGVYGISNYFPTLRHLIDSDLSPSGKRLFLAIALLDNDPKGKQTFRALTARHTQFIENRDIFLLHRKFSRVTTEPSKLSRQLYDENMEWRGLDCVIEDLLSSEILEAFLDDNPGYSNAKLISQCGAHHLYIPKHAKAGLLRFARENAIYEDMITLMEVLKSFRYYLGLDPSGGLT
jgi:hypothetical protein